MNEIDLTEFDRTFARRHRLSSVVCLGSNREMFKTLSQEVEKNRRNHTVVELKTGEGRALPTRREDLLEAILEHVPCHADTGLPQSFKLLGVTCMPDFYAGRKSNPGLALANGSLTTAGRGRNTGRDAHSEHRAHGRVVWQQQWELEDLHSFDGVTHLGLLLKDEDLAHFQTLPVSPACKGDFCTCGCECITCATKRTYENCNGDLIVEVISGHNMPSRSGKPFIKLWVEDNSGQQKGLLCSSNFSRQPKQPLYKSIRNLRCDEQPLDVLVLEAWDYTGMYVLSLDPRV